MPCQSSDTSPKEQFVSHNAGLGGYGGSSAIDGIIMRDKDANTAWSAASDGTLEERVYYCQNWRGDVVALIDDNADQVEQDRYSSYGVPFGLPAGDADSDGDVDAGDLTQIQTWIDAQAYDVRGDLDLNGLVNAADKTAATNNQGTTLGWGNLSIPGVGNRKGYGGYELDPVLAYTTWHVRYRVLLSDLGRWITRDPIEYAGEMNLYEYVNSNPLYWIDPFGLLPPPGGGGALPGGGRRTPPDAIYPPGYGLALCAVPRGRGSGGIGGGGGIGIDPPGGIGIAPPGNIGIDPSGPISTGDLWQVSFQSPPPGLENPPPPEIRPWWERFLRWLNRGKGRIGPSQVTPPEARRLKIPKGQHWAVRWKDLHWYLKYPKTWPWGPAGAIGGAAAVGFCAGYGIGKIPIRGKNIHDRIGDWIYPVGPIIPPGTGPPGLKPAPPPFWRRYWKWWRVQPGSGPNF